MYARGSLDTALPVADARFSGHRDAQADARARDGHDAPVGCRRATRAAQRGGGAERGAAASGYDAEFAHGVQSAAARAGQCGCCCELAGDGPRARAGGIAGGAEVNAGL